MCRANVWAREAGRGRHSLQPRAAGKHFTKTGSGHLIPNTSILPRQAPDILYEHEHFTKTGSGQRTHYSHAQQDSDLADSLCAGASSSSIQVCRQQNMRFLRHTRSVVVRHAWRFGADTLMRKNWLACLRSRHSHSTSGRSGRTCAVAGRQSFSCSRPTAST